MVRLFRRKARSQHAEEAPQSSERLIRYQEGVALGEATFQLDLKSRRETLMFADEGSYQVAKLADDLSYNLQQDLGLEQHA